LRDLVREGSRNEVLRFFDRIMQDERCSRSPLRLVRRMLYKSAVFPASITCASDDGDAVVSESRLVDLQRGPIHVAIHRVDRRARPTAI